MAREISVYTDYVCPYCFLAEKPLSEALAGSDVRLRWRSFELRPFPVPTLRPEDPYLPEVWQRSVYPLAERLGVPIRLPSISPQPRTNKAFQVFALAEEQGLGHAWSMRVYRAFFQENRDVGSTAVLAELAAEVGLGSAEATEALRSGRYEKVHQAALRAAADELGIRAVPTIIVGSTRIEGMPTARQIREAVETV